MMTCKYYKPEMDVLLAYCQCLYTLPDCGAGGYLHILLDDNNYDNECINYCLNECLNHPEWVGSELGILICHRYLQLNMRERSVFDWYWSGHNLDCHSKTPGVCYEDCELIKDEF